mgnify:CR=1 FL=1
MQIYEKEIPTNQEQKHDGDPRFLFHEFQFALARVAIESQMRQPDKKGFLVPPHPFPYTSFCVNI